MQIIIKRKKRQIYVISKVNPERRRRSKSLEEDQCGKTTKERGMQEEYSKSHKKGDQKDDICERSKLIVTLEQLHGEKV